MKAKKFTAKSDVITINGYKFREDVRAKLPDNVTFAVVSRMFGGSKCWFSHLCLRNRASKSDVDRICMMYGLKSDDYIVADEPKPVEVEPNVEPVKTEVLVPTDTATLLELIGELERRVNELEEWKRRVQE